MKRAPLIAFMIPLLIPPPNANAELAVDVSGKTMLLPSGTTRYEYTVTNQSYSTENVSGFILDVGEESSIEDIKTPREWQTDYSPEHANPYGLCGPHINWTTADPSVELRPGSKAVFSFTSKLPPGEQSYSVYSLHQPEDDPLSESSVDGPIVGPGEQVDCEKE